MNLTRFARPQFWEVSTGFCTHTITSHTAWVRALAVRYDGSQLASGGNDSVISVYDADSKRVTQEVSTSEFAKW